MRNTKFRGPQILGAVALLCLIGSAVSQATTHGVLVQGASYNAGAIASGTTIRHGIRVVNLSSRSVLVSTMSSCGRTMAELTEESLAPLSSRVIRVQVDTQRKRAGKHQEVLELVFRSGAKSWRQTADIQFDVQ